MSEDPVSRLGGRRLLLGVTGSIAAYKAAPLVRLLTRAGAEVQVLMTAGAEKFISATTMGTLSGREVLVDIFPEGSSSKTASWTRHVELGIWADLFIVAPATAQTIAKLARGFCDSMLTATALSARCPLLVCPAMDHDMYGHPATQDNLRQLDDFGYTVLRAEHGELASGLVGEGRLPEPETIFNHIAEMVTGTTGDHQEHAAHGPRASGYEPRPLDGKKVLVTAGPTREPIDPVRHLSNPSSGRMGFALADAAARRGADVILVSGPSSQSTPPGVRRIGVVTADEMRTACLRHADVELVCMAAAVSDYRPTHTATSKMKKGDQRITIELERTPDILAEIGRQKRADQCLLGFALETDNGEEYAREKLERKNLDWIALNRPETNRTGFEAESNEVILLGRDGSRSVLPLQSKQALADEIIARICTKLSTALPVESPH